MNRVCIYCGQPTFLGYTHRDFAECTFFMSMKVDDLRTELSELQKDLAELKKDLETVQTPLPSQKPEAWLVQGAWKNHDPEEHA